MLVLLRMEGHFSALNIHPALSKCLPDRMELGQHILP